MPREINNILVIRNDRFGEFLLNIPALRALKETFPQAKLTVAVSSLVKELADAVECVDQAVVWDKQFRKDLRKQKFDLCVILNPTKEAHWAAFRAGIPVRVGYDRKWRFLLTHKLKDTKQLGNRHEVECNLELVRLIGAEAKDTTITLRAQEGLGKELIGQEMIAIHPFTSDPVKLWPQERFMELAGRLAQELNIKVVFVGRTEDGKGIERNKENLATLDLVNKTSLVELAGVFKQCKVLVTCDSGPMHLAAAVGTPVVALFRNDLPGKTAHRWGPWGKSNIVIEKSSLLDISVEQVLEAVRPWRDK